ncbi:MAG: rhodanese-like domain-containing protein [Bdellovibrionota bacterium]
MDIIKDIEPEKVWELSQSGALLLDVRGKLEFMAGVIPGSLTIPHTKVPANLAELEAYRDKTIITYCAVGGRSSQVQAFLIDQGFSNVLNGGAYSEIKKVGKEKGFL